MTRTLTAEQKSILIGTCNAMINRETTSDYSANLREVAKIALSVLTTEAAQPVAWRHDDGPFAGMALTRSKSVADSWIANGWTVTPLYVAPTVVPREMTKEDAIDFVIARPPFKGSVDCVLITWNACRAAMLALERGNGGHDGKIID